MVPQDAIDPVQPPLERPRVWQRRRRADDGDDPQLWRLALAVVLTIVALAAAGSLLA